MAKRKVTGGSIIVSRYTPMYWDAILERAQKLAAKSKARWLVKRIQNLRNEVWL